MSGIGMYLVHTASYRNTCVTNLVSGVMPSRFLLRYVTIVMLRWACAESIPSALLATRFVASVFYSTRETATRRYIRHVSS